jgi:hypothetical protein
MEGKQWAVGGGQGRRKENSRTAPKGLLLNGFFRLLFSVF